MAVTFIGLGRMGAAMSANLHEQGFTVHGFDANAEARTELSNTNTYAIYDSVTEALTANQGSPKVVWLMVPSQFVDSVLTEIKPHLTAGDIIIDGGNSFFKDTLTRFTELQASQIHYIDCGTSGGVSGARHGASLMVGGEVEAVKQVESLFTALAVPNGYGRVGGPGAGHFVKMVHNGIEYGMMGALAEGVNILEEHEEALGIDVIESLKAYEHGSIISSSLTSWLADAYNTKGYLEQIAGEVPKGETEMEMEYLVSHNKVDVLKAALEQRRKTRIEPSVTGTLISAMRNQFGGHKTIDKS